MPIDLSKRLAALIEATGIVQFVKFDGPEATIVHTGFTVGGGAAPENVIIYIGDAAPAAGQEGRKPTSVPMADGDTYGPLDAAKKGFALDEGGNKFVLTPGMTFALPDKAGIGYEGFAVYKDAAGAGGPVLQFLRGDSNFGG